MFLKDFNNVAVTYVNNEWVFQRIDKSLTLNNAQSLISIMDIKDMTSKPVNLLNNVSLRNA